uniref:Secreted protein n=1 Tax=Anguilla anguilla TaxID=7936 RepID=A0A0E9V6L8_ANGAN
MKCWRNWSEWFFLWLMLNCLNGPCAFCTQNILSIIERVLHLDITLQHFKLSFQNSLIISEGEVNKSRI